MSQFLTTVKRRRCVYDIENYPNTSTYKFKDCATGERFTFVIYNDPDDENKSVNDFLGLCEFIDKHVQWLIGYNNHAYDDIILNYLVMNKNRFATQSARLITKETIRISDGIINNQRGGKPLPEIYLYKGKGPYKSFDLISLFNTIDRVGLKNLAVSLNWPILEDLPIKPGTIVTSDQLHKVLVYQDNDVEITERVLVEMTPIINERIEMSKTMNMDLYNRCDTEIAKLILGTAYETGSGIPFAEFKEWRTRYEKIELKNCVCRKVKFATKNYQRVLDAINKKTINPNKKESASKKKKEFEYIVASKYVTHTIALGGIHSNNPPQIFEENENFCYIDVDVSSFYPFLLINEKLYPKHLGESFIKIYEEQVVLPRIAAKKNKQKAIALILKISANGTYGLTKSPYSWLYDPMVTQTICITGQLYILMLIEALELYSNCIVVYSNTDGITVRVPRHEQNLFNQICNRWMHNTKLELEATYYRKMIIQDVNNYLIFTNLKGDDAFKAKGSYVWLRGSGTNKKPITKGYDCPVIARSVFEYFDKGTPVQETIMKSTDIYEFMKAEKTSVEKFDVDLYQLNDYEDFLVIDLQKNNRWIITNGNPMEGKIVKTSIETNETQHMQKEWKVTVLNNVPTNATPQNMQINYSYYINEALNMISLKPSNVSAKVIEIYEQGKLF